MMKKIFIETVLVLLISIANAQVYAPEVKVQVTPGNNVGVGTDNPVGKLSISNTGTIGSGNYDNSYLYITNGTDKLGIDPNQLYSGQDFNFQTTTFMKFYTNYIPRMTILQNGNIGIGNEAPYYKLEVNGTIRATTFSAVNAPWSDFVFEDNYELKELEEVENFIKINKHLPDIPSEREIQENGLDLPSMDSKLLQKIEELTLYIIEMNKENQEQRKLIGDLQKEVAALKNK